MNRNELIRCVTSTLRDAGVRKSVSPTKQVLHITDNEGNSKDFVIKKSRKGVLFTNEDIEAIIDTCISVIEDTLKRGDSISIRGFGTLYLNYRMPRTTKHPTTHEPVLVKGRYTPKFDSGSELKMCAKLFELSRAESEKCLDLDTSPYCNENED